MHITQDYAGEANFPKFLCELTFYYTERLLRRFNLPCLRISGSAWLFTHALFYLWPLFSFLFGFHALPRFRGLWRVSLEWSLCGGFWVLDGLIFMETRLCLAYRAVDFHGSWLVTLCIQWMQNYKYDSLVILHGWVRYHWKEVRYGIHCI